MSKTEARGPELDVFSALVKDERDILGALAYVLYKQDKRAYAARLASELGRRPEHSELDGFMRMLELPDGTGRYRQRAEALLNDFLDEAVLAHLQEYRQRVRDDEIIRALQAEVGSLRTSFASRVKENVVAGMVTTLMMLGVVLLALIYADGPQSILRRALDKLLG